MSRHLLVTNDFPPKVGGIQSYLWELWRRLPPDSFSVLTTPYRGAAEFDRRQPFEVVRTREPVLLPSPYLVSQVKSQLRRSQSSFAVVDPALPLGLIGPWLEVPYVPVLHGAEVTIPGRLPVTRQLLSGVLQGAAMVISAGGYPEREGRRAAGGQLPPVVQIPPGVDVDRFVPMAPGQRPPTRARFGLPPDGPLICSVSRLVPRKGMDVLVRAAARLQRSGRHPGLTVAIAGDGRDRARLQRIIDQTGAPARLLGRVPDGDLPALYGCADLFVLCCRSRWWGLEQEGFGIVLLEAAASGVACVAGRSGGAEEAVADGRTGLVVDDPEDDEEVAVVLERLLTDGPMRQRMGAAGRERAVKDFSYDVLAARLGEALAQVVSSRPGAGGGLPSR